MIGIGLKIIMILWKRPTNQVRNMSLPMILYKKWSWIDLKSNLKGVNLKETYHILSA